MEKVPAQTERINFEQEMPPEIERRLVLRLLGHWRALCGNRKLPAVSDIDPAAIPDLWPHSFLLDVDGVESDPVFRALGDAIDKYSDGTLVGKRVSDAPADALPGIALAYVGEVLEKGVPVSRGGEFFKPGGTRVLYRSILLPVGENENTVGCILGAANSREVVEN